MKYLPNVISVLRIAGSIGLLFCDVTGWPFWVLYALCGISDMVDGWLARKLQAETKAGSFLDSVADIVLVACCAIRILPVLEIPVWLWIWAGVIVFIKIVNQISALVVHKRFCFPHTLANKLTGLLLFLAVPTMFWSMIPIAIVAAIATFAAIQERHYLPMQSINLIDNQLVKSFVVQIWFRKNGYHLSLNRTEFESESTNANIGKNLQTVKESGQALSER